ncbi:hypothetical protein ACLOJK_005057 [Asimina triloba]
MAHIGFPLVFAPLSSLRPLPPSPSPLRPPSITALCVVAASLSLPLPSLAAVVALLSVVEASSSPPTSSADSHPPSLIGLKSTSFHIAAAA